MSILNLTNEDATEVRYKPSNFPDGQQNIKIVSLPNTDNVLIKARLNNFLDLELILCAVKSLRQINPSIIINLYTPYFLGSRSDRSFQTGENNYLKDVICPIINSLKLNSVTVLNPHSDVLEACLNNFIKDEGNDFNKYALEQINNKSDAQDKIIFMSPDAGALKKIYKTAEHVYFKGEIICCNKSRDLDGKITKTEVPHFDITKDVVIFDDICDGGRTFIEIAKIIKQRQETYMLNSDPAPHGKIYLVVTHGIFSKGLKEVTGYFDKIYTTNSYQDLDSMSDFCLKNERYLYLIHQFNIF